MNVQRDDMVPGQEQHFIPTESVTGSEEDTPTVVAEENPVLPLPNTTPFVPPPIIPLPSQEANPPVSQAEAPIGRIVRDLDMPRRSERISTLARNNARPYWLYSSGLERN